MATAPVIPNIIDMTEAEFLGAAASQPQQVNVWYTKSIPYTVKGVTIPTIDNNGVDTETRLEQMTQLLLPVNEGASVIVDIVTRRLLYASVISNSSTQGIPGTPGGQTTTLVKYYYFVVVDKTFTSAGDQVIASGNLIFMPNIEGQDFTGGSYNVLVNNAQIPQTSEYIMKADRIKAASGSYVGPSNILQLQNGTAELAEVQDSLYSLTGWTQARYEGTKTSGDNYSNIDAALSGTSFEGSFFERDLTPTQIKAQVTQNTVVYTSYFSQGVLIPPTYEIKTLIGALINTIGTVQDTPQTPITTAYLTQPTDSTQTPVTTGDLLKIGQSTKTEIVKITSIQIISTGTLVTFTRQWDKTIFSAIDGDDEQLIYRITPIKLFKLQGNIIETVATGQVLNKNSQELLFTDALGYVVSGSSL